MHRLLTIIFSLFLCWIGRCDVVYAAMTTPSGYANRVNYLEDAALIGYWSLNGNSEDYTANNNDGTDTNVSYVSGVQGAQCAYFNGTSSKITFGDVTIFDGKSALTTVCWVKPDGALSTSASTSIIRKDGCYTALQNGIYTYIGTRTIFWDGGSAESHYVDHTYLPGSAWTFYATAWSNSTDGGKASHYFNGVKQSQSGAVVTTGTIANSSPVLIFGAAETDAEWFKGWLQGVAIFSRKLTQSEIQDMMVHGIDGTYNSTNSSAQQGVTLSNVSVGGKGYVSDSFYASHPNITFAWHCEGTTLGSNDYSVGDTTATMEGAAAINTDAVKTGAYGLDLPSDYNSAVFAISNNDIFSVANSRTMFSFKVNSVTENGAQVFSTVGTGNFYVYYYAAGNQLCTYYNGYTQGGTITLSTDTWYYVEIEINDENNVLKTYVNGQLNSDETAAINAPVATSLRIGNQSTYIADFCIDDVIISNNSSDDLYAIRELFGELQ